MRYMRFGVAALAAAILAACGGGGAGDQAPKVSFSGVVSFGDSLSDVGTYKVGTVAALGGGQYTINQAAGGTNWVELMAKTLKVAAPCAAQTGLDGAAAQGFSVPVQNKAGCTAYAQGGARVTNPVGPGNKLLGGANAILGQLTVPLITQMQNHLAAVGGAYTGNEMVFVLAGGNDVFINLGAVGAGAATPTQAVTAMGVAGGELAAYVKALVIGKGAKRVAIVNLPDVSKTPFAYSLDAQTQGLINLMVTTFNDQLKAGLAGTEANTLFVDAYTVSRDQAANPAQYGLTNVQLPACDLTPAKNPLASSLVCSGTNVIAGGPVDKYQFADAVHPTPYGYQLLAQLVSSEMAKKGWL
jgi:phospholipase/lecithinase/hemolysin